MSSELKKQTIKALFWNFIEKFGQQLLYMITGIIVARIVTPAEYGMVGVLSIFVAFSTILSESGFMAALIRKKEPEQIDFSTIFLFNAGVSIMLYLLLFVGAPAIAQFYDNPQLVLISRVLFSAVIFYAFSLIQQVQLTKRLEFKRLSKINLSALFVASLISVVMAIYGMGVWALVAQTVGLGFFRMLLLWLFGEWKISFKFKLEVLRSFFPYSSKLILVSSLNAFANNLYALIIGRRYDATDVGYYNQANKYQDIPAGLLTNTFRTVLFPVLSRVHHESDKAYGVFHRVIGTLGLVSFPIMFLLIIIAEPLLVLLISDVWLPSVPIFQILCIAGAFTPFAWLLGESFAALGFSNLTLRYEMIRKGLLFVGVLLVYNQGVIALAWLWVLYMIVSLFLSLFFLKQILNYGYIHFFKDLFLQFSVAAVLAILLSVLPSFRDHIYLDMGVKIVLMVIIYPLVLFLLKEKNLTETISIINEKLFARYQK